MRVVTLEEARWVDVRKRLGEGMIDILPVRWVLNAEWT